VESVALPRTRVGTSWILSTGLIAGLWAVFLVAHLISWMDTHRPVGLGLMAQEAVVLVLFLVRRQPLAVTRSPVAWIAAAIGGFGALATRPSYDPVLGLEGLAIALQVAGAVCAAASLFALGRSFGIVAANRGVQTRGPYRIVRHPAYASYILCFAGYLLENPSAWNGFVIATVIAFQLVRIRHEEACLAAEPEYRAYRQRVRWRLIPYVY
jgi:protein-S-isoprenylcysteine O-methyltransferase Ste14